MSRIASGAAVPRTDTPLTALDRDAHVIRALAELLRTPPNDERLLDAKALLHRTLSGSASAGGPLEEARAALGRVTVSGLRAEWDALLGTHRAGRCFAPKHGIRVWSCVATAQAPDDLCATDLCVVASLTDRAVWASKLGNHELAEAVLECRLQFLEEHVVRCAGALERAIQSGAWPVLSAITAAMAHMVRSQARAEGPAAPGDVGAAARAGEPAARTG